MDNEQSKFNGTSFAYDADGHPTSDGSKTYTWDARGHLTGISGGTTASFVYDAFGRRMSKTIGSNPKIRFLYDGPNPVQELNGSNGVVANLLMGLRVDEYFTRTDSATSTFLSDALGSTIGMVGAGGTIATSYTYQPFGATTTGGTANGSSYQFAGRENDGTGLYFTRARYYSPNFQRFVSQDPIGFAGRDPDLYGYALNDPMNLVDPTGLDWVYEQSTGELYHAEDNGNVTDVGTGYAGSDLGLNNPVASQSWPPDFGSPLPQGTYTIGPQQDNVTADGTTLLQSMKLTPDPGNQMFGHSGYLIHGPHGHDNMDSSNGCPVFNRGIRDQVGDSGDPVLRVVP